MTKRPAAYVGIDWGAKVHQVHVADPDGVKLGSRGFGHGGAGLAALAGWIRKLAGANPDEIAVGIETPNGPVVEALLEHGFRVHAVNPRQLDRFRDRFFPSGSKDDSRDAKVLADALRTDRQAFRALAPPDPLVLQLREHARLAEELVGERTRLQNRLRAQLWRYYPQFLELGDECSRVWLLDLWEMAPTPEAAQKLRRVRVTRLLKRNRIRRLDADGVLAILHRPALKVAPGTTEAAVANIAMVVERLRLVFEQQADVQDRIDELTAAIAQAREDPQGEHGGQRDVAILSSIPGVGRMVLATLLTEAYEPLQRRDYHALRSLTGVAPVTRQSGKSRIVVQRRACHRRLSNAAYHWARVAVQHDPVSRIKYDRLRARGHRHARALRAVADRLLAMACAMLREQTLYEPKSLPLESEAA